jgi:Mg2+ and Co2+ transporter CorA
MAGGIRRRGCRDSSPSVAAASNPEKVENDRTTPRPSTEVASHLQAGGFFWLDLEDLGDDELAEFSQSLQLPADTVVSLVHASARSSFAPAADSVQAVLPAAVDTKPTAWLEANYVTVVLTERFLFTVHAAPCAPRPPSPPTLARLRRDNTMITTNYSCRN